MTKEHAIRRLLNPGVVAILRADDSTHLLDATRALIDGGISAVEITMTTPNALQVMAEIKHQFGEQVLPGIGSVLDVKTARAAVEAGAEYVVTPVLKPDVIAACIEMNKTVFAGSYTPTEAQNAFEVGADFIKIFPSNGLGPDYISAIRGPLPHLKIVPTGGITTENSGAFIRAGCVAVAAGSTLVSKNILQNREWAKLSELAAAFVDAVTKARKK